MYWMYARTKLSKSYIIALLVQSSQSESPWKLISSKLNRDASSRKPIIISIAYMNNLPKRVLINWSSDQKEKSTHSKIIQKNKYTIKVLTTWPTFCQQHQIYYLIEQ